VWTEDGEAVMCETCGKVYDPMRGAS